MGGSALGLRDSRHLPPRCYARRGQSAERLRRPTSDDVFAGADDYRTTNLSAQAAIGVQTLRQTFDWSTIERQPGVYDLTYHDRYVAKAAAHGIRILPVLLNPPSFRRPSHGRAACPPYSDSDSALFAQLLVHRYRRSGSLWRERPDVPRGPIVAWQIRNEPNLTQYWCPRPSAKRYVAMQAVVGTRPRTGTCGGSTPACSAWVAGSSPPITPSRTPWVACGNRER